MNLIGQVFTQVPTVIDDDATDLDSLVDVASTTNNTFTTLRSVTVPAGYTERVSFTIVFEAKCQNVGHFHHIHVKKASTSYSPAAGNTAQSYIGCTINGTTYRQFRFLCSGTSGDVFNIVAKSDDGIDAVYIYNLYVTGKQYMRIAENIPTVDWSGACA